MANVWGTSSGLTGKTTNNSVNTAEALDNLGDIDEIRTYGGKTEVTEEAYLDTSFTNAATNGQEGTSGIITQHNLIETNTDWQRTSKTTVAAL